MILFGKDGRKLTVLETFVNKVTHYLSLAMYTIGVILIALAPYGLIGLIVYIVIKITLL